MCRSSSMKGKNRNSFSSMFVTLISDSDPLVIARRCVGNRRMSVACIFLLIRHGVELKPCPTILFQLGHL